MEFINDKGKVVINNTCTIININNTSYSIIRQLLFTKNQGCFETDEMVIKYNLNQLHIYTKNPRNTLIDSYNFSKFTNNTLTTKSKKFILKPNYIIELNISENIINVNNIIEKIIDVIPVGNDIIYTTELNNKLTVSKISHNKWNGNPIGIF